MSDFKEILEDALRALEKVETVMPSEARALHEAKQALKKAITKRERKWYALLKEWIKKK